MGSSTSASRSSRGARRSRESVGMKDSRADDQADAERTMTKQGMQSLPAKDDEPQQPSRKKKSHEEMYSTPISPPETTARKMASSSAMSAKSQTPSTPVDEQLVNSKADIIQEGKRTNGNSEKGRTETSAAASSAETPQSSTPPRRQTTRMRKPSSRLLPSPSPPPPQRSTYQSYMNKINAANSITSLNSTASMSKSRKSTGSDIKITPVPELTPSADGASVTSSTLPVAVANEAEQSLMGQGKRKRRPSTMTRPPSTITKAPSPAPNSSTSNVGISKVRHTSVSKEEVPEASPSISSTSAQSKASRKSKCDGASSNAASEVLRDAKATNLALKTAKAAFATNSTSGYESDGNAESALLRSLAGPDGDEAGDEDSDCGILATKQAKRSPLSVARKQVLSASRVRSTLHRQSSHVSLEPPPLISRRGGLKFGASSMRQSGASKDNMQASPNGRANGWVQNGFGPALPLLRFRLDNLDTIIDEGDSSAAEDEEDFHVAMLSGCDLDISSDDAEMRKATASPSLKGSPRVGRNDDDSDLEYTPATTPQSPRSACDASTSDRRASAEVESVLGVKTGPDAVFAHALETSSHRPHVHAGHLTLSLPFEDESTQQDEISKEEAMKRNGHSSASFEGTQVKREDSDGEDDEMMLPEEKQSESGVEHDEPTSVDSDLISTSSQPLAFSTKQALLAMSSPNPCSAFPSPNVIATRSYEGADPAPLSLPVANASVQSHSSGRAMLSNFAQQHDQGRTEHLGSLFAPHEADGDTDIGRLNFGTLSGFYPPECVCLSELDRAWEQSEGKVIAVDASMPIVEGSADHVEEDTRDTERSTPNSEADVEQLMGVDLLEGPVKDDLGIPSKSAAKKRVSADPWSKKAETPTPRVSKRARQTSNKENDAASSPLLRRPARRSAGRVRT